MSPRVIALLAVLAAGAMAGCTQAEPSHGQRQDGLVMTIEGDDWHVQLPLPTDGAIDADMWRGALHVSGGEANLTMSDDALAVDVRGNGTVILEGHIAIEDPDCCLRGFLEGAWTAGDADAIPVEVLAGNVTLLSVRHDATSCTGHCDPDQGAVKTCGRALSGYALGLDVGANTLAFRDPSDHCPS